MLNSSKSHTQTEAGKHITHLKEKLSANFMLQCQSGQETPEGDLRYLPTLTDRQLCF